MVLLLAVRSCGEQPHSVSARRGIAGWFGGFSWAAPAQLALSYHGSKNVYVRVHVGQSCNQTHPWIIGDPPDSVSIPMSSHFSCSRPAGPRIASLDVL